MDDKLQELLQHLEENITGIQYRAARLLLHPVDTQGIQELIANVVGLVSGIKSGVGGDIPNTYPQPLSHILRHGCERILQAGGKIKISQPNQVDFSEIGSLNEGENFFQHCDSIRFTVQEEGADTLLIDVIS